MKIYYYPKDDEFQDILNRSYSLQGFEFELYEPDIALPAGAYIILQEPVWRNGAYLSCGIAWKHYFQQTSSSVRLIIARLEKAKHSNYLYLLDLPPFLHPFLEQALPCCEDWQVVDTKGMDVSKLLKRFFDGHGSDSIRESFSKINRNVRIIADELVAGTSHAEIVEGLIRPVDLPAQWRSFRLRWENYLPWFQLLPFFPVLQKADAIVRYIAPYFESSCENLDLFGALAIKSNTDSLKELLDETGRYVS